MATPFKVTIVGPGGLALDQNVESLVAPGREGDFGVLAHHAPMIVALRRGITRVTLDGGVRYFVTGKGVLEVSAAGVNMLVDTAEKASDLQNAKTLMAQHLEETGETRSDK
jgi:F-type H+-transporting ATPase subunit epsilon